MMSKQNRRLTKVIAGRQTSDGAGVKLKRIINPQLHQLDPFILFDEFGSDKPADYLGGFPDHPHRGFETVTYMLAGAMLHRDHLGNECHLQKGDVQWMTAARGIIHSEMPEQENGLLHGFQLWLNLPANEKMGIPKYRDIAANDIPIVTLADNSFVKVIAGAYQGESGQTLGAVTGLTTQPVFLHVQLNTQQQFNLTISLEHTVMIYVFQGEVAIGSEDSLLKAGHLGQLVDGDHIHIQTKTHPTQFLVLAAKPLNEPVVQSGPFVMNTMTEIEQAFRDYRNGVLAQ